MIFNVSRSQMKRLKKKSNFIENFSNYQKVQWRFKIALKIRLKMITTKKETKL